MNKTTRNFVVPCYMADDEYRLRASAFMDVAQDMALQGSQELGFGFDRMNEVHMGWVLYRMYFKFLRPVIWREHMTMNTWHKGLEGLVFLRDFELLGADGERAVVGTSSWVVLDMQNRSFVRNDALPPFVNPEPQNTEDAVKERAPKVVVPAGLGKRFDRVHTIRYSDTDFNGHTNNVKYVVWAMDRIDPEFASTHQVKEIAVNFNRETKLGDIVQLFAAEELDGDRRIFYVEGFVEGRQSFAVKIVY
jgi:acyl-ACP thioesterase